MRRPISPHANPLRPQLLSMPNAAESDSHLGDELNDPDIDERRRAAEDRDESDTKGQDMPEDSPEPRRVEDPRARVLLEALLVMTHGLRGAYGMGYFKDKLNDKHAHFEMIQRWTSPPPDEWLSAFLRWKMFAKLRVMMGEISQDLISRQHSLSGSDSDTDHVLECP